ncbi:MAG: type II secretion system F family protein [Gammaproteobacteria bacterium]|nr:type II secretion system F family protein [Gammaproteobacteria bacterium]
MEEGLSGPMPFMIMLAWGLSGFCFLLLVFWVNSLIEEEDRAYMDPLPPLLKLIWPFVQIIANFAVAFLPYDYLEYTEKRLQRTGVSYLVTAEQFIALQLFLAMLSAPVVWMCLNVMQKSLPLAIILAPFAGFLFPNVWLADTRKRRELGVIRSMPVYLDFITMCVEAGLNLSGALAQAMEKGPPGPLRNEFAIVLRDLRAGVTRADALRRMADRLDILEVTSFVSAVIQAEKMGASLASVLRVQAEQRRNERFQRAEKLAMEAPIKLVGPLILFIFPVTFIVLAFPIVMKFMAEGSM